MIKRFTIFLIIVLGIAAAGYAVMAVRARDSLSKAEILAQRGNWPGVRRHLERYLWLHPNHAEARLRLAEALSKDDRLPARESAPRAIAELQKISNDSSLSARARTEEGRLHFLILHRAARAEALFQQAIDQAPDFPDAYYMMWKLMDLTGRSHLTSSVFWKYYELAPPEARRGLLREWYMGQFYSVAANTSLDHFLGFLGEGEEAPVTLEPRRFLRFRETEPQAALGHAALARWFLFEGDPKHALSLLERARDIAESEETDPFFAATLLETLIELGEFDRAAAVFKQWPGQHDGYEYWHARAIILDEIEGDFAEAEAAYERALAIWPGPVDWRSRHRLASCLTRLGKKAEAKAMRKDAERVEIMMQAESHKAVHAALGQLDNPHGLRDIVDFYRKLNCLREADVWQDQIDRLNAASRTPIPRE